MFYRGAKTYHKSDQCVQEVRDRANSKNMLPTVPKKDRDEDISKSDIKFNRQPPIGSQQGLEDTYPPPIDVTANAARMPGNATSLA